MKKIIAFCILSLLLYSCATEIAGDGAISTQTYTPVTNFTKVSVDHDIDVTITQGAQKAVHITGYDNLLEHVKITASGGVLRIGMDNENTYTNMNLTAIVVIPSITEVSATHAGNISIETFPAISSLTLNTSGSGNIITMSGLSMSTLAAHITNTGSVTVSGSVDQQTIDITGSGNYDAFDLFSNTTTVNCIGSGDASVNAKILLDATIIGSGNILYKRYPEIQSTITGSGILIDSN